MLNSISYLIWGDEIPSIKFKIQDIYRVTTTVKRDKSTEITHYYFASEEKSNDYIIDRKLRIVYFDESWVKEKVRAVICEDGEIYLLGQSLKDLYSK